MIEQRTGLPRLDEAEISVLGAFMRDGSLVKITSLDPADFYSERHRSIFEAMLQVSNEGDAVDIVTVKARLARSGALQVAGGDMYLMELCESVVSTAGWESWEKLIRDYSIKRQCIGMIREANSTAFEDTTSGVDLVDKLQAKLNGISSAKGQGCTMFSSVAGAWISNMDKPKPPPLKTGFTTLDSFLRIRPKQLGVVAARPGCGKTSFATQVAMSVGMGQGEVLFNNLEMGDDELMLRMMSQHTCVPSRVLEDGNFSVQQTGMKIVDLQMSLDVNFCFQPTPEGLRSESLKRKAQGRLKLVVIDYLQLMAPRSPSGNDVADLSYITRFLKLLAKELDIPVIALSQFSRETAKQGAPKLHHLRGSGSIEQDADWVLFLYEETDEDDFFGGSPYKLWELAKQRGGARSDPFRMAWDGRCTRFSEFIA